MKRLAAALVAVSTLGILSFASPASAAALCLKADININGQAQSIDQCLPQ